MHTEETTRLRQLIERFVKLTDDDWNLLTPHLQQKELRKQELFATEGKVARKVGFVLEGNMRHYYTRDGEEKTTYFYFENSFVAAYISCITGQPSLLNIEALTECRLLVFPYKILK